MFTIRRFSTLLTALTLLLLVGAASTARAQNTITVNSTADTEANDGECTLREAIKNAKNNDDTTGGDCDAGSDTGTDMIAFNIPGAGPHTITPTTTFPNITDPVVLDGTTQPGADCAAWPPTLQVVLDGTNVSGNLAPGLKITGDGSTVRGLVIHRFPGRGLEIKGGADNRVECNFIGTDVTGTTTVGRTAFGVLVTDPGASGNLIGGTTETARNLIAGSRFEGVNLFANSSNNLVQGNYIGTDVTGTVALGNGTGVSVSSGRDNTIGGTAPGAGNLISGNSTGVCLCDFFETINTIGNVVQGNLIGTDVTGTAALGNTDGVFIVPVIGAVGPTDNTIGGTADGAGNTIAYNTRDGVNIAFGDGPIRNRIQGNAIFENGQQGIDLNNDGVTANDPDDADTGPNRRQNYPVIAAALTAGNTLTFTYSVDTETSNAAYPLTIDFYLADADDEEGQTYLGNVTYAESEAQAPVTATLTPLVPVALGDQIVATATDDDGNTSEFSGAIAVASCLAVTTTEDVGPGSLRQALTCANDNPGFDTISFAIDGSGPYVIEPATALPEITGPVMIDGTSQPDNEAVCTEAIPDRPAYQVILFGNRGDFSGLVLGPGSDGSTIRGLNIQRFRQHGILVNGSDGNTIACNFIGTDEDGDADQGNGLHGVYVIGGATNTLIGGATPDAGNLLSGNNSSGLRVEGALSTTIQSNVMGLNAAGTAALPNSSHGIRVTGDSEETIIGGAGLGNVLSGNEGHGVLAAGLQVSGLRIQGNFIGTDATGTVALGNTEGLIITGATNNLVGGPNPGEGNVISGNRGIGLSLDVFNGLTANNTIQGNLVGTDITGTLALGNAEDGISINKGSKNLIGGSNPSEGNVIAHNGRVGVRIIASSAIRNEIRANRIFANSELGIDLVSNDSGIDGPTANDPDDADTGPNQLQNYPELVASVLNGTGDVTFAYRVDATPAHAAYPLAVEFFLADADGEEGQVFLGAVTYAEADAQAVVAQTFTPAVALSVDDRIVATATDQAGNTSEFSSPLTTTLGPDLSVTKDADTDTVALGDVLTYTVTVNNLGTGPAVNVVATDTPPPGLTLVATSGCQEDPNGLPACSLGTIASGESVQYTIAMVVDAPAAAGVETFTNMITVSSPVPDLDESNNTASVETTLNAVPDLALNKDDGDVTSVPGEVIAYTLTYTNNGNQGATGVVLSETVPDNTTFDAAGSTNGWTCDDTSAGSACTFAVAGEVAGLGSTGQVVFAVEVVSPVPAGTVQIDNTASVTDDGTNGDDPNPDDNTDGDTTPVEAVPDLVLSKDDGGVSVMPGEGISYTLSYENTGTQDATGVILTETVPANTTFNASASTVGWVCTPDATAGATCTLSVGSVAAGAGVATAIFAVDVVSPVPAGTVQIDNTASVADDGANGVDPNPDDNTDSDTTPVGAMATVSATKVDTFLDDGNGDGEVNPGETLRYTVVITNDGDENGTGVVFTDLASDHPNTTLVAGSVTTTGGTVSTGNGTGDTDVVVAVGALPGGGGTVTITFEVTVDDPLPAGVEQVCNQGLVTDNFPDVLTDDPDEAGLSDPTCLAVEAAPDLVLSKDDGGVTAMPGEAIAYTLSYENVGDQDATGVTLSETVPANTTFNASSSTVGWVCTPDGSAGSTCTFAVAGEVAGGGGTGSADFAVVVDSPVPAGTVQIDNTATVADDGANGSDPNPDDNSNSDTTPVGAMPDVLAEKVDTFLDDGNTDGLANPGETIRYTTTITNNGDEDGTGVVFTDLASDHPNTTLVVGSVTASSGAVATGNTAGDTDVVVDVGALPGAGGVVTITFAVVIDAVLPTGVVEVCNQGLVTDNFPDVLTDDPDDATGLSDATCTPVEAEPDLVLTKDDGDATVLAGGVASYTLTYENVGNQGATGVVLSETVPANTSFDAGASTPGWVCTPDGSAGSTCTFAVAGEVASGGGTGSADFAVRVDTAIPAAVAEIINTASVADDGANGADPNPDDNSASDTTPVEAIPEVVVTKVDAVVLDVVGSPGADPGDRIKYTVTITNNGDREATGITFTDTVDPNTSLDCGSVSATPMATLANCTPGAGGTLTIDGGTLAGAGSMITITFEVVIATSFPTEVFEISNQGKADGDNFPEVSTDDPETAAPGDATVTAINASDLAIVKTLIDFTRDDPMTFEATFLITVANHGPSDATGVVVDDPLPEGATLVSQSGGYDEATGLWTIGALANGASASLTLTLGGADGNDLVNIARVDGDQPDPEPGNNLAGSQAQHDRPHPDRFVADLSLTKTVDNATPSPGSLVTYTLAVINEGPSATSGVSVQDRLPAGVEFVSATASTASMCSTCGYNDSLGVWIVGHVSVGSTATLEITARVVGTGEITNTAEVLTSTLPDPDSPHDNSDVRDDDQDSAVITVSGASSSGQAEAGTSSASDTGVTATAVEQEGGIPEAFVLEANYPNPFNPQTRIPFAVPQSSHVMLEVYDLLGKRVAVLLDEELSAGRYEAVWEAVEEPSGVYLVRLVAGSFVQTRRVTLVK